MEASRSLIQKGRDLIGAGSLLRSPCSPDPYRAGLGCHNNDLDDGGISFENRESLLKKAVIVPLKPEASRLLAAIRHDGKVKMPPQRSVLPLFRSPCNADPYSPSRCLGCHNNDLDDGGISFENRESLLKKAVLGCHNNDLDDGRISQAGLFMPFGTTVT